MASAYNDERSQERLVFSNYNNSDHRQLKATNQDWLGGLLDIVASMIGIGRCHWLTQNRGHVVQKTKVERMLAFKGLNPILHLFETSWSSLGQDSNSFWGQRMT